MSLAVITDSSVNLPAEIQGHADVYVLDIPVIIEGQPFVEGKNLDVNQFYEQMANSEELLKTSQPNLADLDNLLMEFEERKVIPMSLGFSFLQESLVFGPIVSF